MCASDGLITFDEFYNAMVDSDDLAFIRKRLAATQKACLRLVMEKSIRKKQEADEEEKDAAEELEAAEAGGDAAEIKSARERHEMAMMARKATLMSMVQTTMKASLCVLIVS